MNKIIAAFNGLRYSAVTAQYAVEIAKENNAHLVGIFLEDFTYHSYNMYELVNNSGIDIMEKDILEEKEIKLKEKAVETFVDYCTREKIEHSVHHDRNIAIKELMQESAYADLLIISAEETIIHYAEDAPTTFIRALLPEVQCPVLIVPGSYYPVKTTVFLYDGLAPAAQAIRKFVYSCTAKTNLPLEIVTVNTAHSNHLHAKKLLSELLGDHFPNIHYTSLEGNPGTEVINYLSSRDDKPLVILGAYSRNIFSMWLKRSMADKLMKELRLPLFIAHN